MGQRPQSSWNISCGHDHRDLGSSHQASLFVNTGDFGHFAPVALGEPDWRGRVDRRKEGDMIEAVLGNDVEIALLGRFDGDDILSLIGQLKPYGD